MTTPIKKSTLELVKSIKNLKPIYSEIADEFEELTKDDVNKLGFDQEDKHLNRVVRALPGNFIVVRDPDLFYFYRKNTLLDKYAEDWDRMTISFLESCNRAKNDPDSRQLMIFNDQNFSEVKQCFTQMQFVMTRRKEYDLYVYQRSADMVKFRDDITFFAHVAEAFEEQVGKKVTKIVVVYGNIHFTKE